MERTGLQIERDRETERERERERVCCVFDGGAWSRVCVGGGCVRKRGFPAWGRTYTEIDRKG